MTRAQRGVGGGLSLCKEHALQPSVNRNSSCGPDRLRCGTVGEAGGRWGNGQNRGTKGGERGGGRGGMPHDDGMDG